MNSNYHISAEDGPHNPVTGVPVPVTTSAQRIKQLEVQLDMIQAELDRQNAVNTRLTAELSKALDRVTIVMRQRDEAERKLQYVLISIDEAIAAQFPERTINILKDAADYGNTRQRSPRAAVDADISASQVAGVKLADMPLDELLKMDLTDPKVIEAIASKPRPSNLQTALGR